MQTEIARTDNVNASRKTFLFYIENIRAIAIILVVLCHLSLWSRINPDSVSWVGYHLSDATAVFVFISGFLFKFLADKNGFSFFPYIKKKILNVLLPYLLFIAFATVIGLILKSYEHFGLSPIPFSIWSVFIGGSVIAPLWFVPMIFLFFLSSSLWIALSRHKFFYIFTYTLILFSVFSSRPYLNLNPFFSFLHFSGFYAMGILMASDLSQPAPKVQSNSLYMMIICLFLYFITFLYFLHNPTHEDGFISNIFKLNIIQLGKIFLILFLFLLTRKYLNRKIPLLSYIANISFGLFFVHGFSLVLFGYVASRAQINNIIAYSLSELLISFGLSILIIEIIKKITGQWSRYVLGC